MLLKTNEDSKFIKSNKSHANLKIPSPGSLGGDGDTAAGHLSRSERVVPCTIHRCHRRHLRLIHTLHLVDALTGTQARHALV